MKYIPVLTSREIEENHSLFEERRALYKEKGLDFLKTREFILEKAGPLKNRILDIGSGRGIMALSLARAGYGFTSVDTNEEMLKITALNLAYEGLSPKAELYVMDAYSLEFDDNSFNNIFMVEVLHHMRDIGRVLSEADRVLSKDGKLILADFNKKGGDIVDMVHASEGRKHATHFAEKADVESRLNHMGYRSKSYEGKCHWLLVGSKK